MIINDKLNVNEWFVEDEKVEKKDKIQYESENNESNIKSSKFYDYFKLFSNPINIILLYFIGFFSGFIAIPIDIETTYSAIQIIIGPIFVLLLICIVVTRYIINKKDINIIKNYIFDLVITVFGTISLALVSNSFGWIAYELYSNILNVLFNNRITDLVCSAIFLILASVMLLQYKNKPNNVMYILSRVFLLLSISGLSNATTTFFYFLLGDIFYLGQIYFVSIAIGIVGCIVFISLNAILFIHNERKLSNAK